MATPLTKPLSRELPHTLDKRAAIAHLHPWGIAIRPKGCRYKIEVSWPQVITLAAKLTAAEQVKARKAARKGFSKC